VDITVTSIGDIGRIIAETQGIICGIPINFSLANRMSKSKNSRARHTKTFSKSSSGFGFTGWAIVFLLLVIAVFIGSVIINPRQVQKVERPLSTATLQVLNGCGESGAAQRLADAIMPGDSIQLYDVIEKGDAKLATFDKTTVVDRRGSADGNGISPEAKGVAGRLGIAYRDVILLRLDENILNVDVTVIAGRDYNGYIAKLKKAKEAAL